VRQIVRLARSIRERLRIRHRHPLPALHVAGVDPATLTAHADLLKQEINVKEVRILPDPDRYAAKSVRLNTPELGKRLKQRLQVLQASVAAGEYVIDSDGVLHAADVVVRPGEYSHQVSVVDRGAAVAAEGSDVVQLDTTRDEQLRLEGDARDLNRVIQDLRKRAGLGYSDRIILSITGSGLEPLLTAFGPWVMEQSLAVAVSTTPLHEPLATSSIRLGSASAHVGIACASSDRSGPNAESTTKAPQ
jgi:isoleucyl-tRNA synthetase